jgi:hypothetical protein
MSNPANYKTQSGLIKALEKASQKSMDVSLAWWYKNAEHCLIKTWGWEEKDAAVFIMRYKPITTKYHC